jgi:hypothetical protein
MNRQIIGLLAATIMILGGIGALTIGTSHRTAEAQLIDIDVDGAPIVIIGEEPVCVRPGVYSTRRRWMSRKLAVYLDGKRCQCGVDYREDARNREIQFLCKTSTWSVVIVDYVLR